MAAVRGISGAGRGLLVVGAAALIASLLVPSNLVPSLNWFTVSGHKPGLPEGTYTGLQTSQLLGGMVPVQYAWLGTGLAYAAFGLLFVAATAALAVAGMGRRTRNVGTGALLLVLIQGALLYYTAYGLGLPSSESLAALSVGYGYVAAVAGGALIEAGGRIPGRVPMMVGVPAGMEQENP